jgi:O-antigen/teichoic acid export membrane protein
MLTRVNSLAAVGQLALAARLISPLDVMLGAFGLAYNPVYFAVRKHGGIEGERQLAATTRHVWLAAVAGCLGAALLGPPLVILLVPASYHPAAPLIPVLALNFVANTIYIVLGAENFYSKRVWLVSIAAGSGLAVMLLVAMFAAPAYGPLGIAWAQVAGTSVATAVAVWFALHTVRVPHDWYGLSRAAALALVAYVVVLLIPVANSWQEVATGTLGVLIFVIGLAALRDPTLTEVVQLSRRFLGR